MLTWNVYTSNFNGRRIEKHNVFDHGGFLEDCRKAAKKCKDDRDAFSEAVQRSLMYYYWSKCEWEVLIRHWPPHEQDKEEKVDVYDQVMMNWDHFMEYLWNNRKELAKKRETYPL